MKSNRINNKLKYRLKFSWRLVIVVKIIRKNLSSDEEEEANDSMEDY